MQKEVNKEELLIEFLINQFSFSHKKAKMLLTKECVLVDNKTVTKYNFIVKKGQIIFVNIYNKSEEIQIIYEDKNILVVDKPTNLLTVANEKKSEITLYSMVSKYVKKDNKKNKIFVVHRLDRETSGVVLFAKSEIVKQLLQENWDEIAIKREYIAIVEGKMNQKGTFKSYLKENANHYVYSSNTGKLAITHYKKIKETANYTWLSISIDTGRKNQIRVQLKENGTPILGDKKYGCMINPFKRLCLHAYQLVIFHPITKKEMIFTSTVPKEFR